MYDISDALDSQGALYIAMHCTGALHMLTPAQTVCVVCAPHLRR